MVDTSNSDYCAKVEYRHPTAPSPSPPTPAPQPQPQPTGPSSGGNGGQRLRLYWEDGYYWQETHKETFWCMECNNPPCDEGNNIYIRPCRSSNQKFVFDHRGGNEYMLKLIDPNKGLCLNREGNSIKIRNCDSSDSSQRWIPQRGSFDSYRFEITPKGQSSKCITQRHHPKDWEIVEIEPCALARSSDTSFWETY